MPRTSTNPLGPAYNRQLFENSGLQGLFEEDQAKRAQHEAATGQKVDPLDLLFNAKTPNLAILHEKIEHRICLYMKAQGASNRAIAEVTGYTEPWLSQLFRQPWAQERLLIIMNDSGKERVSTLIASAAEDSVFTLIDLRDNKDVADSVRARAADSLLDRYLGKPHQHVDVMQVAAATPESVQEIERQIDSLNQEANRLCGLAGGGQAGGAAPLAESAPA